jgi:mannosyl-3-phosphoglycerate phosphatase family protein
MRNAFRLIPPTGRASHSTIDGRHVVAREAADPQVVVFAAVDDLFAPSAPSQVRALRRAFTELERSGVPVVIWSDRTRAEIEMVRQQIGSRAPFISEEGAALFVPACWFQFPFDASRTVGVYRVIEFGANYDQVVATLHQVAASVGVAVTGLRDLAIEEVAKDLRISLLGARLVKLREYGELFRIDDPNPASRGRLFRALRAAGLACWHGTPFDYASGLGDKRVAIGTAQRLLAHGGRRLVTVGIGSRPHHLPVLHAAEVRIVIRDGDTTATAQLLNQAPLAHVVQARGAEGWVEALARIQARAGIPNGS